MNQKIIETLFDCNNNIISLLDEESNNILLEEEGKDICLKINSLSLLEKEFEKNVSNFSNLKNLTNNNFSNTKKTNDTDDEKSSTFGSKLTKADSTPTEELKKKLIFVPMDKSSLSNIIKYINQNENKEIKNKDDYFVKNIEKLCQVENYEEIHSNIKKCELRKIVLLKLFKAFNIIFKKCKMSKKQIQNWCLNVEYIGRVIDSSMSSQYKLFILNLLKKISM